MRSVLLVLLLLLPSCSDLSGHDAADGSSLGRGDEAGPPAGVGDSSGGVERVGNAEDVAMEQDAAWLEILRRHKQSHPEAEAVDLYKFLHQGVLGPGHMIADRESALSFLHKEIEGLKDVDSDAGPRDRLLDAIDPGEEVLRLHLRPFLAAGGIPDSLAEAFIRSASLFDPEAGHVRFVHLWKRILPELEGLLPEQAALPSGGMSLDSLDARLATAGYPIVRHSEAYRRAYRPAYRVVLRRELMRACPGLYPDSGVSN